MTSLMARGCVLPLLCLLACKVDGARTPSSFEPQIGTMSETYPVTNDSTFHEQITIPLDGDPADAGSVHSPFCDLADNEAYLRSAVSAINATLLPRVPTIDDAALLHRDRGGNNFSHALSISPSADDEPLLETQAVPAGAWREIFDFKNGGAGGQRVLMYAGNDPWEDPDDFSQGRLGNFAIVVNAIWNVGTQKWALKTSGSPALALLWGLGYLRVVGMPASSDPWHHWPNTGRGDLVVGRGITAGAAITAGLGIQNAGGNITAPRGDIEAIAAFVDGVELGGNIKAHKSIAAGTAPSDNITAGGSVTVGGDVVATDGTFGGTVSTAEMVASGLARVGSLDSSGGVSSLTVSTGRVNTTGDVNAAQNVLAGGYVLATGQVIAGTGLAAGSDVTAGGEFKYSTAKTRVTPVNLVSSTAALTLWSVSGNGAWHAGTNSALIAASSLIVPILLPIGSQFVKVEIAHEQGLSNTPTNFGLWVNGISWSFFTTPVVPLSPDDEVDGNNSTGRQLATLTPSSPITMSAETIVTVACTPRKSGNDVDATVEAMRVTWTQYGLNP